MSKRAPSFLEQHQVMSTSQIVRKSIRILLLHTTRFNSISIFFYSPVPISLFISHFLIHHHPRIASTALEPMIHFLEEIGAQLIFQKLLLSYIFSSIICFPSAITFSLVGKAATIRSVVDSYNGRRLTNGRLALTCGIIWVKLLNTLFWEFLIILCLFSLLAMCLVAIPSILYVFGICSKTVGFLGALGFMGIPFCIGFAHVTIVGNLAMVVSVLEGDYYGLEALMKAMVLIRGRRQTALLVALLSNVGLRLVEVLFEFRMSRGMHLWESYILVSMYSMLLVWETVMSVVFYCTSKLYSS